MSFFNKNRILLAFLNNDEFKLAEYRRSRKGMEKIGFETLRFSADIVKDSGILNKEIFSDQISKLLGKNPEWKEADVLLVIPEEKIFIKGFDLDLGDLEKRNEFRENFIGEVPFDEDDLIVRERLVGRVLEFSAVHKQFVSDLEKPFTDAGLRIVGLISVPQAIALNLDSYDKSFLLAFYDNDFALALVENASIIFSETWRLAEHKVKEAILAFEHFSEQLKAGDIRSILVILGEDELEDQLKTELESRGYSVKEIKKIGILDMIADYYFKNPEAGKNWNLLHVEETGFSAWLGKNKKSIFILIGFILTGTIIFAVSQSVISGLIRTTGPQSAITGSVVEPMATSTAPVASTTEPVQTLKKSDFPVVILNGTKVAGEATRLKSALLAKGFFVTSIGNNSNQNLIPTSISISGKVPDAVISELRMILESVYQQVLVSPSAAASVSIRIVIGKKK